MFVHTVCVTVCVKWVCELCAHTCVSNLRVHLIEGGCVYSSN